MLRALFVSAAFCALFGASALPAAAATLEEMAGQMIVVGFEGEDADAPGALAVAEELAAGRLEIGRASCRERV